MGRRSGLGILFAVSRDIARQQRRAEAEHRRQLREAERQERAARREEARVEREYATTLREIERAEKAEYVLSRQLETEELNEATSDTILLLSGILEQTLTIDDTISFDDLRIHDSPPKLPISPELLTARDLPSEQTFFANINPPTRFGSIIPGAKKRYTQAMEIAKAKFEAATERWHFDNEERLKKLRKIQLDNSKIVEAFEAKKSNRNAEVDQFESSYFGGEASAIESYCAMVLERSNYPDKFPQNFSLAYSAESRQIIVEYELPNVSIVPEHLSYSYVKSKDTITSKPMKLTQTRSIYQDLVASIALRTIHELFEADQGNNVDAIVFNGYINTIDLATGKDISPHLISVRTTKDRFLEIDLSRISKTACLKNLGAQISRQPDEAQPVKPVQEFRMSDPRFVGQGDIVSGLSAATNLMDLSPFEFEHLVANLFGQMGLESKLTRSSRDGGVDCIAYDLRPVLGGKVVIQAKRYRNTVGVSAVRDLFGTMLNEGANKGILVTTSGYGPDAFEFSRDKPIELIDGGGLLYLLGEIGYSARIVMPEEM